MKNKNFISLFNYKGFTSVEDVLMSLIVGLSKSNQRICFSNGYAALKTKSSIPTITRTIKKFVMEGYIECIYTAKGRIIHLIKEPEIINHNEECDISTPNQDDYTPNHSDYTPNRSDDGGSSQGLDPLITTITNRIDDNIDNNIDGRIGWQPTTYPNDFLLLVERYNEPGVNMERAFKVWEQLSQVEKQLALDNMEKYFLFLDSDKNRKNWGKQELFFYLNDRTFTYGQIKNFRVQPKQLSNEEKNKLAIEQFNKFLSK